MRMESKAGFCRTAGNKTMIETLIAIPSWCALTVCVCVEEVKYCRRDGRKRLLL